MNRFISTSSLLIFMVVFLFVALFPKESDAIPSFARKYEVVCSTCHVAWPQLNKVGRDFKENGYKFSASEEAQVISDFLHWEKVFPITAVITSRPYDEQKSDMRKIRALHEVELMVAGMLYKSLSGFFEIEAEDEKDFEPEIPIGVLGYHPMRAVNLQLSYSPLLWADPYDTYASHRQLTRGAYSVIDQKFGGADNGGRLRDSRQTIALYGRPMDMLFYSIGFSGVAEDTEGKNANNFHARLTVDVVPEATIGLFGMNGRWKTDSIARDFNRIGLDIQADFYKMRFLGVYLRAKDDLDTTGDEKNDAWYAQAFYVFEKNSRPLVVPLLRYDSYEKKDGKDRFDEVTLNVSYYFTQNIKGFVEFWTQTDIPNGATRDHRFTVQIVAAF